MILDLSIWYFVGSLTEPPHSGIGET